MKHQPLILGVAAAVITIGIGVGVVLAVTSDDDNASGTATPTSSQPHRSRSSSTSSSTRSGATTNPGSAPAAGSGTATPTTPAPTAPPPPDPPDPVDQYHPLPLPPGVGATISSCGWSGGQLHATGTLTNLTTEDDFWDVDVFWLVFNQTQNEDIEDQNDIYDVAVGQTISWNLSISYPLSPPNLSCALEVS